MKYINLTCLINNIRLSIIISTICVLSVLYNANDNVMDGILCLDIDVNFHQVYGYGRFRKLICSLRLYSPKAYEIQI